jgi:hypothetical protein
VQRFILPVLTLMLAGAWHSLARQTASAAGWYNLARPYLERRESPTRQPVWDGRGVLPFLPPPPPPRTAEEQEQDRLLGARISSGEWLIATWEFAMLGMAAFLALTGLLSFLSVLRRGSMLLSGLAILAVTAGSVAVWRALQSPQGAGFPQPPLRFSALFYAGMAAHAAFGLLLLTFFARKRTDTIQFTDTDYGLSTRAR